ncbi:M23 family metallopeptidase [bacterium]|nr:M23 family metallopeptidase [bacterium]
MKTNSLFKTLNILIFIFITLIFSSCAKNKTVKTDNDFPKSLLAEWNLYLNSLEKEIQSDIPVETLFEIKKRISELYIAERDTYDSFPAELSLRVSRVIIKIDKISNNSLRKNSHQKELYKKDSIDIIPNKMKQNYFIGTIDDGDVKSFTQKDLKGRFIWPIESFEITSNFGYRKDPFLKSEIRFHSGIDLGALKNTPVKAAESGKVIFSGENGNYGITVIIQHNKDMISLYAHLDNTSVSEGEFVKKGKKIGEVGETGRATGPHLHFEIRVKNSPIDPFFLVEMSSEG